MKPSIFAVKNSLNHFGFWYALHRYGFKSLWDIFVAWRMIRRDEIQYEQRMNIV